MSQEMAGREFAHLAGADQQNMLALQRTENLLGQLDGHGSDGYGGGTNGSLAADTLGDRECASQQGVQLGMNSAHGAGQRVGFLHLSQDLWFAHYHGIQARSNAEDVADGIIGAEFVKVLIEIGRVHLKVIADEATQVSAAVFGFGQQFHPIAGAQDHALFNAGMLNQLLAGLGQA